MIMAEEKAILKAKIQFNQMEAAVRNAAAEGCRIDQVERDLWARLLSMGRVLLEAYVQLQGTGDIGPTLEYSGRKLNRLEDLHGRRYVSVFGELNIRRTVYGTRETQKHEVVPLDARLALPESDFSYLLQDWDQSFCVDSSYEESRAKIQRILGIGQSVLCLEQMNTRMASDVEDFRDSQPTPEPADEGPILVLTADGKGVPIRRERGQQKPVRLKRGQKANKKRQACVGGVYTVEPFIRSADDIVNEVMRKECHKKRPMPKNKQLRAELTRPIDGKEVNGKDRTFCWFAQQVNLRNPNNRKPVICVMDGNRALWQKVKQLKKSTGINIVCILDLYHALERLWSAAYCFHPEGSDQAQRFVTDRLRRILEGQIGYVIGGLKQMGTKHKLSKCKRQQLSQVIAYLKNNRSYMKYDRYLSQGYPIGSGVVEGACRHLVKDRMERTGMHWRIPSAQAMLDLRATYLNGDWDVFQQSRVKRNIRKMYPYRNLIQRTYRKAG